MKRQITVVVALLVGLAAAGLRASGQAGIDGVIQRVVFEPSDRAPERVPESASDIANAKREWADLASVAGTRQAVAFGYWDRFRGDKIMRIRTATTAPEDPDVYLTDVGVAKLGGTGNHAAIVSELLRVLDGPKAP